MTNVLFISDMSFTAFFLMLAVLHTFRLVQLCVADRIDRDEYTAAALRASLLFAIAIGSLFLGLCVLR
jgi:hypothetical protein